LAGKVPGDFALKIGADEDACKDHDDHDAATNSCRTDGVEESEERCKDIKLHLDLQTPGDEVEKLYRKKVSHVDDVRQQRRDERPETMLADGDGRGVEQERQDVGRFEPGEATAQVRLDGDGLPVKETLSQKRLSQNEAADGEEEEHPAVAVINKRQDVLPILIAKCVAAAKVGLSEDMHEQSGGYRDETEAVDLGDPVSVSCDATKFHSSPKVSGGADSIGGRKSPCSNQQLYYPNPPRISRVRDDP